MRRCRRRSRSDSRSGPSRAFHFRSADRSTDRSRGKNRRAAGEPGRNTTLALKSMTLGVPSAATRMLSRLRRSRCATPRAWMRSTRAARRSSMGPIAAGGRRRQRVIASPCIASRNRPCGGSAPSTAGTPGSPFRRSRARRSRRSWRRPIHRTGALLAEKSLRMASPPSYCSLMMSALPQGPFLITVTERSEGSVAGRIEVTSPSCANVRVAMTAHGTTGPTGLPLTREALAPSRRRLHDGRNRTKAVIDRVDLPGGSFVVKDVATRPFWVRRLLGPWQLGREVRAYGRLAGLPGIPRLLGVIDEQAIALELVDGRPLQAAARGSVDDAFFDRLEVLVGAMHARGVAHGDLHHGDVLVARDGRPYVVDFSTSWIAGPRSPWPSRALHERLRRADLRSRAKLRRRYAAGGAPPEPPRSWISRAVTVLRGR